jgi:hypothetical protein
MKLYVKPAAFQGRRWRSIPSWQTHGFWTKLLNNWKSWKADSVCQLIALSRMLQQFPSISMFTLTGWQTLKNLTSSYVVSFIILNDCIPAQELRTHRFYTNVAHCWVNQDHYVLHLMVCLPDVFPCLQFPETSSRHEGKESGMSSTAHPDELKALSDF